MKAGDEAYLATCYSDGPKLARVTVDAKRAIGWGVSVDVWLMGGGQCFAYQAHDLHPTLTAALAWLIERTAARLAEQERAVAQTRETLGELQVMLEGVGG